MLMFTKKWQEEIPGHVQTGGDGRAEGKSGGLEEDEAEDG